MVGGRLSNTALMNYVLLPKRIYEKFLGVNVCEGGEMSDSFLVDVRLKVVGGWRSTKRMVGVISKYSYSYTLSRPICSLAIRISSREAPISRCVEGE